MERMLVLPTLFLALDTPSSALDAALARSFREEFGGRLRKPRAILVACAQWRTKRATIGGAPALAERAADLLCAAGLASATDGTRGLDADSRAALSLLDPAADIPVAQISIQPSLGPAHHLQIGGALAALRREEVLVVGSGSLTPAPDGCPDQAAAFGKWMDEALREGRRCDLLLYRGCAPFAAQNHPTGDGILPLFIALGAAGKGARAERLEPSAHPCALGLDAYAFHSMAETVTTCREERDVAEQGEDPGW